MSQRPSLNNFLIPVENRLSNNTASYDEAPCNDTIQSFSGFNSGESSSRLSLQNNQESNAVGPRSEERRFEQSDYLFPGRASIGIGIGGNQLRSAPSFSQGSSFNNISPNLGYLGDTSNGRSFSPNQSHSVSTSLSSDVGPSGSSGYSIEETSGGPGGWGLSCKRKALEGTSGHSNQQTENVGWHTSSGQHNASSSLSLSPPTRHSPSVNPLDLPHTRIGLGRRDNFPSRSIVRNTDSFRHQQESSAFNLSTTGYSRRSNAWSLPQPFSDPLEFDPVPPTNSIPSQGPFNRTPTSASSRSISRNNGELAMFLPVTETRHTGQDPSSWSLGTGISPSSSIHPLPTPTWLPHHNFPTPPANQQRFSEFAPWSLFPSMESESGGQSGHFPPLSSVSSSQETSMSSGSSGQGHNRQIPGVAFMEGQGDDVLGTPRSLRALAADIEGRQRFISEIRQVLSAMRRDENLRIEDYMVLDPLMHHGMAEMHDRHRDMRLDVDNMSYEELLALEERIGDVSTGLTEPTILKSLKRTKYFSIKTESRIDVEPCSICQEEYIEGDEVGKLECGHEFHTDCIKQWLMLKNLCPICKMMALPT